MKKLTYLEPVSFGWFNAVATAFVGTLTAILAILVMLVMANTVTVITPAFLAYAALKVLLTSVGAFIGGAITAVIYNVMLKDKTPVVGFTEETINIES